MVYQYSTVQSLLKKIDKRARTAFQKNFFYLIKQILCNFYQLEPHFYQSGAQGQYFLVQTAGTFDRLRLKREITLREIMIFVTISAYKQCSIRLYLQLFVAGLMSYLRYLCLFAYSGVTHILLLLLLVLFVFVLYNQCCQFFWIVHS